MSVKMIHYFASGNTAKGYYDLYHSVLSELDTVFILTGRSLEEKAGMIGRLAKSWSEKGFSVDCIHSPHAPGLLEAMLIRELGFGIADGDRPWNLGDGYAGDGWETVDLDVIYHPSVTGISSAARLEKRRMDALARAGDAYSEGLKIHDEWEKIYIDRMDFKAADQVAEELIVKLFNSGSSAGSRRGSVRRRFLGAATPEGPVDYVDAITSGLSKRIFLKGRAGTGKSTVLKKIVAKAELCGYDMEIYHCGLDPDSLDMVLVRELGWAVFDSTPPHEYFPSRAGDEIIDMYELAVTPGTDEMFAEEIRRIEERYREKMVLGKTCLQEAKQFQNKLESLYKEKAKQPILDDILQDVHSEIERLANENNG